MSKVISLNDYILKLTSQSFQELSLIISSFPSQSLQLKTEKLILYYNKYKKKYLLFYYLLLFFNFSFIRSSFLSISNFFFYIFSLKKNFINKIDYFFYLHLSLYNKRLFSLKLKQAKKIIKNSNFEDLPSIIFFDNFNRKKKIEEISESCKKFLGSSLEEYIKNNKIEERLNILIRSKLLLEEKIPLLFNSFIIQNGFLKLIKFHLFEVSLSLSNIIHSQPMNWIVLNVSILTHHHERERLLGESDPQELNSHLLQSLQRLSQITNSSFTLQMIGSICLYTSLSHCLRLLYVQGLDFIRTILISTADVTYLEQPEKITVSCLFWKEKKFEIGNNGNIIENLQQ